jgi:hypothetical protein
MALKDETADALFTAIKEAVGQTKDIQALHVLAESFAAVAGTGLGARNPARSSR